MTDRTAIVLGALAGAVVGSAFGYLYLSDDGRRLRKDLEPELANLATEFQRTLEAAGRARDAVEEGWHSVSRPATAPTRIAPASDG